MNYEVLAYAVALGAVIVALIAIYIMRRGVKNSDKNLSEVKSEDLKNNELLPLKGTRSVTAFDAQKSKKELRILDVEQEILSFGIRRIYEAQAEGKIDEKERDRLATNYKAQMRDIKESIDEKESVVALHDLETMQDDLIKLFNDRFDEINKKIGGLRTNLNLTPKAITPKPPRTTSVITNSENEKTSRKKRTPSKPKKTEAEERIDQIKSEVEKVLARLGQMETEA